jgi:predicted component of type VI protein secretion system
MRAYLVSVAGRKAGTRVPVTSGHFLIGRDAACDLRAKSSQVSPRHCVISNRNGRLIVRDLNSSSGTYVNDRSVRGDTSLAHGDKLRVGPLMFVVHCAPASKPERPLQQAAESDSDAAEPAVLAIDGSNAPDDADVLLADVPGWNAAVTVDRLIEAHQPAVRAGVSDSDPYVVLGPIVAYVGADSTNVADARHQSA